jgi:hypothetical protein
MAGPPRKGPCALLLPCPSAHPASPGFHEGMWQRKRQSIGKGIAAGLIGGLAASWVMDQFQAGLSKLKDRG